MSLRRLLGGLKEIVHKVRPRNPQTVSVGRPAVFTHKLIALFRHQAHDVGLVLTEVHNPFHKGP